MFSYLFSDVLVCVCVILVVLFLLYGCFRFVCLIDSVACGLADMCFNAMGVLHGDCSVSYSFGLLFSVWVFGIVGLLLIVGVE